MSPNQSSAKVRERTTRRQWAKGKSDATTKAEERQQKMINKQSERENNKKKGAAA